jgi:hypothetical protein
MRAFTLFLHSFARTIKTHGLPLRVAVLKRDQIHPARRAVAHQKLRFHSLKRGIYDLMLLDPAWAHETLALSVIDRSSWGVYF